MKQKRIVCVVVDDGESWSAIDGQDFERILKETLLAYEFTTEGVEAVRQALMGNQKPPIGFRNNAQGEKTNDDPI